MYVSHTQWISETHKQVATVVSTNTSVSEILYLLYYSFTNTGNIGNPSYLQHQSTNPPGRY